MSKLFTEHNLEFISLKGGCTSSSESTLVKMPHCWKSHAAAQLSRLQSFCLWTIVSCIGTFIFASCLFLREVLDSLAVWEADWQIQFNVAK